MSNERRPRPSGKARASLLVLPALLAGLALGSGACAWDPWIPKERPLRLPDASPREGLVTLTLGEPHDDVMNCSQNDCNHWFRVDVHESGRLRVAVDPQDGDHQPILRALLRKPGQPLLAQGISIRGEQLLLESDVERGMYLVLVQGGGDERTYRLIVILGPPGAGDRASAYTRDP